MIKKILFEQIHEIWKNNLWPNRKSKIETNSAMNFLNGYDMNNMKTNSTFFAYIIDDKIVGVNSGHLCGDSSYRSRGLYVFPTSRNLGIGKKLLLETIAQAKRENAKFVWSYPKQSSWKTYSSAGFTLMSDWHQSELDINAYCKLDL